MKLIRLHPGLLAGLLAIYTPCLQAQVPQVINYQGRISISGTNPAGPALDFKFALVNPNGTTTHWSHDNSSVNGSEPTGFVTRPVSAGLFSVALGDTTIPGMTKSVSSSVFDHNDVRLRIWVRDTNAGPAFELLSPDQRIGAVGYAMMSASIVNGTVTQNKLDNNAVTEPKLADEAVASSKLASNGVTTVKIADGAVTTTKLASNSVTTPKIINSAVTVPKLGADVLALIASNSISGIFGTCSNCGSVDILGASNCNPAITLDGCVSQIAVLDPAGSGRQMILLDGQDSFGAGQIRVRGTNTSAYTSVMIAGAGSSGSAQVDLRNSTFGLATVELWAHGPNTTRGGYVAVSDIQGHPMVQVMSDQGSSDVGGRIDLFRPGTTTPLITLDASGSEGCARITTPILEITGGCDLSENFEIKSGPAGVVPGMIVCIDPETPGHLVASAKAYDAAVAGIVSGAGGVRPGMLMGQHGNPINGRHPVALTGRVYCMADADRGSIRPGDLVTTSDTPGHAMKAADLARAQGAIIGKAMTKLETGKGLVLVLVSLQ